MKISKALFVTIIIVTLVISLGVCVFVSAYVGNSNNSQKTNQKNNSNAIDFSSCKTVGEVSDLVSSDYNNNELPDISEDTCDYIINLDGWNNLTVDQAYIVGRLFDDYSGCIELYNENQEQNNMWNTFRLKIVFNETWCICINDVAFSTGKKSIGEYAALVSKLSIESLADMNVPEHNKAYSVSEHPEYADFVHLMWDSSIASARGSDIEHILDIWGAVIPGRDDSYFSCNDLITVISYTRDTYGDGNLPVISEKCREYINNLEDWESLSKDDEELLRKLLQND